jgi:hypothetical protein
VKSDLLTLDVIFQTSSNVFPDLSKLRILWPIAHRNLVIVLIQKIHSMIRSPYLVINSLDIFKTGVFKALHLLIINKERIPKNLSSLLKELFVKLQVRLFLNGAVVAAELHISLCRLHPASWGTAAIGLAEKGSPVFDSAENVTNVDKVELIGLPSPLHDGIIYLETNVWGYPFRLTWREIGTNDFSIGITIG